MEEIEPKALKKLLDEGKKVFLLDVRHPEEQEFANLKGGHLIPLMELPERLGSLKEKLSASNFDELVCYCKLGGRSGNAIEFLESQGISGFKNLRGGINAYAEEADSELTPY